MSDRIRILLVDDETDFLTATARIISSLGYEVECAVSGDEALVMYKDSSCDLLITDLKMPVMDGFELIHKIRAINSAQRIIVSTAMHSQVVPWNKRFARSDTPGEGVEMSTINFLLKPFSKKTLAIAIEKTLMGELFWPGCEAFTGRTGRKVGATPAGGEDYHEPLDCFYFIDLYRIWRNSVSLKVSKEDRSGTIYIREGEVIHAETGDLVGEEALEEILSWKEPLIKLNPCPAEVEQTVHGFSSPLPLARERKTQTGSDTSADAQVSPQ